MARIQGRPQKIATSCPVCDSKLAVVVRVDPARLRKDSVRLKKRGPSRQELADQMFRDLQKALGIRKPRKDKGQPKPKKKGRAVALRTGKVPMVYEEPQGEFGSGSDVVRKKRRACGCNKTGRHRKACALAGKGRANKGDPYIPAARVRSLGIDPSREDAQRLAKAKLANASKSEDRQPAGKSISARAKAAIAKLDPVAKPIKAGA